MLFGWTSAWKKKRDKRAAEAARNARGRGFYRPQFETLEDRHLLSVSLGPIVTGTNASNTFTVPSGKELYVPLPGSDAGQTVAYSASSSNSSVVATVMPSSNPTLTLDVSGGTGSSTFSGAMTFELFSNLAPNTVANIVNLVNNGEYSTNTAEFYRVLTGAPNQVIQGGVLFPNSTASAPPSIADEFNSALTFNSPGMLAMANAGPNTGSSEFFITAPGISQTSMPNSNWDFQYAVFGQLTSGFNIYNDILNTPLTSSPASGEDSFPASTVKITGASVSTNTTQAGVVQISEPSDFTGSATITVTATGSDSTTAQQTFTVSAAAPAASMVSGADPIVLTSAAANSSTTLSTPQNTAVTLPVSANLLPAYSGGAYTFSVLPANSTFADPPFTSSTGNSNVAVTVTPSGSTASLTLTPSANFAGTLHLMAQVDYTASIGGQTVNLRDDLPFTMTIVPSAPTVTSSTGTKVTAADAGNSSATVSVTYGDNTSGVTLNASSFSTGNITVSNGSTTAPVTGVSVSGNTVIYTIGAPGGTWTNSAQGTYAISVVAGSVTDNNGNGIAASTLSAQLVVDTVAPTATISVASGQANPTSAGPILFNVAFSVPVTGFTSSGLTLGGTAGGTLAATVTASDSTGQNYTVSVSGMANSGTVTAGVNAGAAQDLTVGNNNTASNTASVTFNSAPTATLAAPLSNISASGATGTTTTVQVTYGDSASGVSVNASSFSTGNITVTNGSTTATVSSISVSGNTVTYTVAAPGGTWSASAQGTYTVAVVAGSVTDGNGNPIAASTLGTFVVGTTAPSATISLASSQANPAIASPILFSVAFSEAVTGFSGSGITLGGTASGTLVATVTASDGTGKNYTVSVSGMTSTGTVTAAVKAGAAKDTAGNNNTASTTASIQFNEQFFSLSGKTLTITGTASAKTLLIEFADATDFTAAIGGSSQTYSTTQVTTVNFNGNGTAATFVFAAPGATMGTVSASLVPGGGEIQGPTYTISISGAATNYFYGNSTSSVSLMDTSGSNTFVANHSYAYEEPSSGSSYFNMAEQFGTLSATAGKGTTDTAYFISASGDKIVDTATYGSLAATGVYYSANNFPTVYAFGSATGGDTAWLYGTATGFSDFVGTAAYAYMQGIQIGSSGNTDYFNSMIGFHTVQAIVQSGGGGVASLSGLGSNPEFAAGAGAATMVGGGIQDTVQGFQTINAVASGSSSIALVDGIASHGDSLVRNNGVPTLVGGVYTVQMTGFVSVRSIKNVGTGSVPASAADFVLATIQNWSALANG